MSRLLRFALFTLVAGGICFGGMFLGGWGPCGPSSPIVLIAALGMLLFIPLSGILFFVCGVRALVQYLRARSARVA